MLLLPIKLSLKSKKTFGISLSTLFLSIKFEENYLSRDTLLFDLLLLSD